MAKDSEQSSEQLEPCLTLNCGKKGEWKGLCRSCYGQALRLINTGKTTWEELQDLGLAAYSSKPFMVAFLRKKKAAEEVKELEVQPQSEFPGV